MAKDKGKKDAKPQLMGYALHPEKRKKELGNDFREHENKEREDKFRTAYHRDRDRIIWSTAFRRMQNKTQVFAHDDDDHFRRRLTHSIEVAGIACSVARQLKLNEVATDAIALGHDIGHAPFGHAGEDALNEILREYDLPQNCIQYVPIKGFDHCAHAIEVVSRIETLNGTYPGLGLSFDIRDGILKHIYHKDCQTRTAGQLKERPFSALSNIVKCPKFKEYECNYGSLEAQCVWFADKLTYLFDDIEDAIRAKIFAFDIIKLRKMNETIESNFGQVLPKSNKKDILGPLECDIMKIARSSGLYEILGDKFRKEYKCGELQGLKKKSDIIQNNHPNDDVRQFLFWRNKTMTVMIKNCIEATSDRIKKEKIRTFKGVLTCKVRLVDVSDELKEAWREGSESFYKKAMIEKLFNHRIVLRHAYNAKQKIRRLFDIYRSDEGYKLIPQDYKDMTKRNYNFCDFKLSLKGVEEEAIKIITIKNYIAGMTDAYVNQMLKEYIAQ